MVSGSFLIPAGGFDGLLSADWRASSRVRRKLSKYSTLTPCFIRALEELAQDVVEALEVAGLDQERKVEQHHDQLGQDLDASARLRKVSTRCSRRARMQSKKIFSASTLPSFLIRSPIT